MTQLCQRAQSGVLSNPSTHLEYLTFCLKQDSTSITTQQINQQAISDCIAAISGIEKSINQKDLTAGLNISIGFSANAWSRLFPSYPTLQNFTPSKR
ncbi:hypothetical protein AB4238_00980 [Shewanella sp. 10N.286.45.A1]|uniref:hypothetical protein n=1 Tax=Shewanella sp. 10N.286.45.A1 TaxID=3229694 RepID=UPI00355095A6